MEKIMRTFLCIALLMSLIYVGSAQAVLWGDTVESKIDVVDDVVVSNDSMLDILDSKIDVIDLELSVLDASLNSGTTILTSADVVDGNIDISAFGNYMLGEAFTSDITITAGCVTLDFNDLCLTGTIVISSDNVTIKDGTLLLQDATLPSGSLISVSSASDRTRITNLTMQSVTAFTASKGGIEIAGNDWIVENCTIITGNADGANSAGHGINLLAAANNILIRNCLISTGDGGSAANAGDGGTGINVNGAIEVEIADCTIFKTGAGGSGIAGDGSGGDGIFIASTSTDISVHNCIIRNTGAAGTGGGGGGVAGKAIDDNVTTAANLSIIFGNFAHNIANAIRFDLQATGAEQGFDLSNPPTSTAVSVYANVFM